MFMLLMASTVLSIKTHCESPNRTLSVTVVANATPSRRYGFTIFCSTAAVLMFGFERTFPVHA